MSVVTTALPESILVVEDDPDLRLLLTNELEYLGYVPSQASAVATVRPQLERTTFGMVLTDLVLPDGSGLDVLRHVDEVQPGVPVLMLSGRATIADAVEAIKRGAVDFLQKPINPSRLAVAVASTLQAGRERGLGVTGNEAGSDEPSANGFVGESPALRAITAKIGHLASTDATVLIQGESGTGKELVARALHFRSARRERPFVAVDCGALEANLLASELFGHVRGAFTGADTHREGLFQAAHQGTLFLDEITNLGLDLQARLLRVLQERRVRPVGASGEREIDVRVIAATNRDLRDAVAEGRFREDLYYRLAVVTVDVPPLRERASDIPLLAHHFAAAFARRSGRPTMTIASEAMARLEVYNWPGNVRELANVVERAVIMATTPQIRRVELPEARSPKQGHLGADVIEPLDDTLRRAEGDAIRRALRLASSKAAAARLLGISRRTLYEKMDRLGVGNDET